MNQPPAGRPIDCYRVAAEHLAVLSAISDPVRWHVLNLLREGPVWLKELRFRLQVSAPVLCRHLKLLSDAGLITLVRVGRMKQARCTAHASQLIAAATPLSPQHHH